MTPILSVPLEIFSCVIERVSEPDKLPTLCALSLVSRYFRVDAQRALFSDPGPLYIGHRHRRHNAFIESIIASPHRLALHVHRYEQHTSWDASNRDSNAWSATPIETTSPQERLVTISRIAKALRSMVNLKNLSLTDFHTYYPNEPVFGARMLLQGCTFQLHSLEWWRRDDLSFLLTGFLPTQNALQTFHLSYTYEDLFNVPKTLRDASTQVFANLQSLSGPRLLSEVILPGKRVKYLRWTRFPTRFGTGIEDIGNVPKGLEHVRLLDFHFSYTPPLSSFVDHLVSLEVLIVTFPRKPQDIQTFLGQLQHLRNLRVLVLRFELESSYVLLSSQFLLPLFADCKSLKFVDVSGTTGVVHVTVSLSGHVKMVQVASSPSGEYSWERRMEFFALSAP